MSFHKLFYQSVAPRKALFFSCNSELPKEPACWLAENFEVSFFNVPYTCRRKIVSPFWRPPTKHFGSTREPSLVDYPRHECHPCHSSISSPTHDIYSPEYSLSSDIEMRRGFLPTKRQATPSRKMLITREHLDRALSHLQLGPRWPQRVLHAGRPQFTALIHGRF